jgi:hypothetical protein
VEGVADVADVVGVVGVVGAGFGFVVVGNIVVCKSKCYSYLLKKKI